MPVQDDERERELCRMFNLGWDPTHQRAGADATLEISVAGKRYRFDVEVKSTTGESVATARDVGLPHITRWRRMLFVVGYYTRDAKRPELKHCLCLTPVDLEPWIKSIEDKVLPDFRIAEVASQKLDIADLFAVCGTKDAYTLADAKRLHKRQWSSKKYKEAMDIKDGKGKPAMISRKNMLDILRNRAKYIAERGATLNNPHIPSTTLNPFFSTNRMVPLSESAAGVRKIAEDFIRTYPHHPAVHQLD